jgi:hypothetical protein
VEPASVAAQQHAAARQRQTLLESRVVVQPDAPLVAVVPVVAPARQAHDEPEAERPASAQPPALHWQPQDAALLDAQALVALSQPDEVPQAPRLSQQPRALSAARLAPPLPQALQRPSLARPRRVSQGDRRHDAGESPSPRQASPQAVRSRPSDGGGWLQQGQARPTGRAFHAPIGPAPVRLDRRLVGSGGYGQECPFDEEW